MQVCTNIVTVNDCPRFLTEHPTEETHTIIADDEWGDKDVLPLCLSGVISYLPVLLLTENEWNRRETPRITLTNEHLTWDPNSTDYEDQENAMTDFHGIFSQISCRKGSIDDF